MPYWVTRRFSYGRTGSEMSLASPLAKLLAIEAENNLETHENPFALVTLAHLSTKRARGTTDPSMRTKRSLFRLAVGRGLRPDENHRLWRFIEVGEVAPALRAFR